MTNPVTEKTWAAMSRASPDQYMGLRIAPKATARQPRARKLRTQDHLNGSSW